MESVVSAQLAALPDDSTSRGSADAAVGALVTGVDPEQAQIRMVPGGNGVIYSIQADGSLLWYVHTDWQQGGVGWANGGTGLPIGTSWHIFVTVLASDDGQLFAFAADGTLRWYKYTPAGDPGVVGTWHPASGNVIGTGFDRYPQLFGGWGGVVYGVDRTGDLWWYHYVAGDGTAGAASWAYGGIGQNITPQVTSVSFQDYNLLWADPNGVIYGVEQGDTLEWVRYAAGDGTNGPNAWANGGNPNEVGTGWGWDSFREAFSNTAGVTYMVSVDASAVPGTDGTLLWYRLENSANMVPTDRAIWSNSGVGIPVRNGFTVCRTAALQGYPDRRSVTPGEQVGFAVSTNFATYQATVLRMSGPGSRYDVVWGPQTQNGTFQFVQPGYRSIGCGWQPSFSVTIPHTAKSGLYMARLEGPMRLRYHIPFVVRPATPSARIALLLPFNTYNAYNHWGGHSQYSDGQAGRARTLTFLRPWSTVNVEPPGVIDAHTYSDLLLIGWMQDNAIAYDCYEDADLHNAGNWLGSYQALVLATHPEYFTQPMRDRLQAYLGNGGRLIYTGGNGIYERMTYTPDGQAAIYRDASGNRDIYRDNGLPESDLLGVLFGGEYMTFYPYRVTKTHPFLSNTGLAVGDQFGRAGYNGSASGWETDQVPGNSDPAIQVIATGLQPGGGANMVYYDKGNGGWVFSASSLSFNGSLSNDVVLSRILRNVFNAAVQ